MADSLSPPLSTLVRGVTYTGGIIGLFNDRHGALQRAIQERNEEGWRLVYVLPPKVGIFTHLLTLLCLAVTVTLWAPEPGETLVFEKRG